jgi:hypothetical protein
MIRLHEGQGLDIYWRDAMVVPSESEYLGMIKNSKFYPALVPRPRFMHRDLETGGLLRLAVKLMHLFCPDIQQYVSGGP